MKKTIQHIAVAIWLLTLTVSTMGFNFHTLYCYCTGENELSLFEIDHKCTKSHSEEDEAFAKLPPCCQKALACHKAKSAKTEKKDDHDCTKKDRKFVKADLKFLEIEKVKLPKIELEKFVLAEPKCKFYTPQITNNYSQITPTLAKPPPQYFGRWLLNFIQVYRC